MRLIHIPKTGGTSLIIGGVPGGHHVTYNKSDKFLIIIRDPVERTLSHFREQRKDNDTIQTWWNNEYEDYMTKWIKKKNLPSLKASNLTVLTTDNLTAQMKILGIKIERLNVGTRKYVPTREEIEFIEERTKLDRELYAYAKEIQLKS